MRGGKKTSTCKIQKRSLTALNMDNPCVAYFDIGDFAFCGGRGQESKGLHDIPVVFLIMFWLVVMFHLR